MAKDRRNKVRPTMDLESNVNKGTSDTARSNGTSSRMPDRSTRRTETPVRRTTTQTARRSTNSASSRRRKKKLSRAALIIRWVIVALVVAFLVFAGVLANYIYQAMFVESGEKVPPINPTQYDVTPVENEGKVAYYLVGILGEKKEDNTAMLSVVCHDKKKNTASIMQLPQMTYIEEGDQWATDSLGAVFANPKALDWCDVCRKRLYEPEINEGDVATHIACGTEVTLKKGSSVSGLVDFVNDQLGLPVDEYFLLPQKAVSILVDAVGGVDVNLGEHYELGGNAYEAGIQTLSGDAAMDYVCYTDGSFEREVVRMIRQREVFGAILTRMLRLDEDVLAEDVVEEVMDSSSAIRTECTSEEICAIIKSLKKTGVEGMTVQFMPGEVTSDADGYTVYSAHKEELLTTLNEMFNPYSSGISAADLLIPELTNTTASDVRKDTLNNAVVEQTGKLLDASDSE